MEDSHKGTVLLIDALSMTFRAFFALPADNFRTATGEATNAVYGFTAMLATLLADRKPTHAAVAFDLPGGTFRTERYPAYKGNRDETPPDLKGQIPLIREVLGALKIPVIDKENYEADDVLATYAARAAAEGYRVLVVSGDRDTLQLVTDDVTVLYPRKGVSDLAEMTPDAVREKYGVNPANYPDLAALVGETSDNLPGVPGVGPKTAAKWVETYGSLPEILAAAHDIPGKAGESLRANLDQVRLNRELNHLLPDLDLPLPVDALERVPGDAAEVQRLCDALEFRGMRQRLLEIAGAAAGAADAPAAAGADGPPEPVADGAAEAVAGLTGRSFVAVVASGASDARAVAVSDGAGGLWAIDLTSIEPGAERALATWLADASAPKVIHGAKDAWHALRSRGLDLAGIDGDTEVAAFLVQPDHRGFDLEGVAQRYLGGSPAGEAAGELDLGMGPSEAQVAAVHAWQTAQLAANLEPLANERGMGALYREMELPLIGVLARMEDAGVAIDRAHLESLASECDARAAQAQQDAWAAIDGFEVNLASPKQLQEVLFDRLGMPKTKRTKTGYSTDASSLAELYEKTPHPFLEALLSHRDSTKLRQIIEGLIEAIAADSRIHTTFSQVVASTGRLSSRDPNLQNIPIRTEDGHRIREAFVVGDGFETLLTADYSQIEMRIMAHLSGDQALIDAFRSGEDLHRFVGSRVFGVPPEAVTPEMRSKVKAMSYGLAYGLSSFGLARQLGTSVGEAQALMDDYYARFGAVRDYLASVVVEARKVGYTETIFGRRRYVPDLNASDRQRRDMAERVALNAPIQGSAADLIKRAMLGVDRRLAGDGLTSRQILQVHDELVVEVAPGERDAVERILREEMAGAADLSVPLDVHVGVGANWRVAGH